MMAKDEGFTTFCKSCGAEFQAPGNCEECGAAFHY